MFEPYAVDRLKVRMEQHPLTIERMGDNGTPLPAPGSVVGVAGQVIVERRLSPVTLAQHFEYKLSHLRDKCTPSWAVSG